MGCTQRLSTQPVYKAVGSRGSRVSRVLWMLEELKQPYEFIEIERRSPEAYALNPSGKVPILIAGELRVTGSAAICVYLADKHAEKGMGANPGLAGRAEMDSWMHFAQSEFEAPLWNKLRHRFILPPELRVDVGPASAHDFALELKTLERRLGDRKFALGDRFSAVDVLLGDIGAWARGGRFRIESDAVNAYLDRVLSRPARARSQANGGGLLFSAPPPSP